MKWIFIVVFCVLLFGIHVCAIFALARNGRILKTRFTRLALFLIISDACMMVEYIWHVVVVNTTEINANGPHQNLCIVLKHIVPAMVEFSLILTLLMCLERLNATFITPNRGLKCLTSNISVGVSLFIIHVYMLVRCILEINGGRHPNVPQGCNPKYSTQQNFLLYVDVLSGVFVSLIAFFYFILMIKLLSRQRRVDTIESLSDVQVEQKKKEALRMRRCIITLSCIIAVTSCSVLPRTLYGLYININNNINNDIIRITNNLLLLNPLIDPFVYIFRIKELRRRLKCKCYSTEVVMSTVVNTHDPTGSRTTIPTQLKNGTRPQLKSTDETEL